jgi:hypothetical protein
MKKPKKPTFLQKKQTQTPASSPQSPAPESVSGDQVAQLKPFENLLEELGGERDVQALNTAGMSLNDLLSRAGKVVANLEDYRKEALQARRDAEEIRKEAESLLRSATEEHEARVKELHKRQSDISKKESEINARELKVLELEAEADNGFQSLKSEMLAGLETEIQGLRENRTKLEQQRETLATTLAKLEDAHRQKLDLELEAFRSRLEEEADKHQKGLIDELLAKQQAWQEERKKVQAQLEKEIATQREAAKLQMDASQKILEEERNTLAARDTELRQRERQLRVDEELLKEDQESLDEKVKALAAKEIEKLTLENKGLLERLEGARESNAALNAEVESLRALEEALKGKSGKEFMDEHKALKKKNAELLQELENRLDRTQEARLEDLERQRREWEEREGALRVELASLKSERDKLRLSAVELAHLEHEKEVHRVHKETLQLALGELRDEVEDLKGKDSLKNPFEALTKIDENHSTEPATAPNPGALKEFAEDLRHRIATGIEGRTLYYSEQDIRAFIGGLAMGRLMLLQGISGTGKTSLPKAFANAVGGHAEIVEVQAGWRDRQDLLGYYNAFHKKYYATEFLQALYKAGTPEFRDRPFIIILDEINLSRPEQFFADFLSTMEQPLGERRVTLMSDPVTDPPLLFHEHRHLPVPPNVWFVGTANHDESTVEFADKTYDRAHVMEMPRNTAAARFEVQIKKHRDPVSYTGLQKLFEKASISKAGDAINAYEWLSNGPVTTWISDHFRLGWGNRIESQLKLFVPAVIESGGTLSEAMDHLVSTKIVRKLRDRHDVRPKSLVELKEKFETSWFEGGRADKCIEMIDLEIKSKRLDEEA